jgi:hypothetical protein
MNVEMKITLDFTEGDTNKSVVEGFDELDKYFPTIILAVDKNRGTQIPKPKSCSWSGSFEDFLELLKLRESFGDKREGYVEAMMELYKKQKSKVVVV